MISLVLSLYHLYLYYAVRQRSNHVCMCGIYLRICISGRGLICIAFVEGIRWSGLLGDASLGGLVSRRGRSSRFVSAGQGKRQ